MGRVRDVVDGVVAVVVVVVAVVAVADPSGAPPRGSFA